MAKIGFKAPNIGRTVAKLIGTLIALWVGGTVITQLGVTMTNTTSPFYKGLSLIGWTVGSRMSNSTYFCSVCEGSCGTPVATAPAVNANCITAVTGTGVLSVIGIIGLAAIVLEFVAIKY